MFSYKKYKKYKMSFNVNIVTSIQRFLLLVKFHHWNTKFYNTHKVTDKLYTEFQTFMDNFTEVYMGFTGQKFVSGGELSFNIVVPESDEQFLNEVKRFRSFLYQVEKEGQLSGDLVNLLQEMQSSINKYVTLLTYK